jgi:DNA-binding MarR family transcriptional regulator
MLPCMCACLRSAARGVTRRYTEKMGSAGLGATQFTLLMVLRHAGPVRQGDLAELISADSTTLTRTLALIERDGWATSEVGEDRRERVWSITPAGRRTLERAMPGWEAAQAETRAKLDQGEWDTLRRLLAKVA